MKYVGYLVLVLLFIYFVFVKPFLLLHSIEFEIKEPGINLKEKSFEIGEFWVLLPNFRGETFFFRVEELALYKDTLKLKSVKVKTPFMLSSFIFPEAFSLKPLPSPLTRKSCPLRLRLKSDLPKNLSYT